MAIESKKHLVICLGNPGNDYKDTRHNAGFIFANFVREKCGFSPWQKSLPGKGEVSKGQINGNDIFILKPHTFMNNSGEVVKPMLREIGENVNIIVAHDDLDIAIGKFKLSHARGSGGHNGVESMISFMNGKDFSRIRIGISPIDEEGLIRRPTDKNKESFVLKNFSTKEREKLNNSLNNLVEAFIIMVEKGIDEAMNKFN